MKLYSISKLNFISSHEYKWILDKFNLELTNDLKSADVCYLGGGHDVSPEFYQPKHIKDHPTVRTNYYRDIQEIEEAKYAIDKKLPIIGTCRGSQLLCVLAGGKLVQHQNDPNSVHNIRTYDGNIIEVTSSHHQSQHPFNLNKDEYEILGYTTNFVGKRYLNHQDIATEKEEIEICFYPKIRGFAIQGHYEYHYPTKNQDEEKSLNWTVNEIKKRLF